MMEEDVVVGVAHTRPVAKAQLAARAAQGYADKGTRFAVVADEGTTWSIVYGGLTAEQIKEALDTIYERLKA